MQCRFVIAIAALVCLLTGHANAWAADESGVPLPHFTAPIGEKCVQEVGFMRRNHMNLLRHQRNETVHKGIRTQRHSLKNCLSCHVPNRQVKDEEHFCKSCHRYAGIRPDCFHCHAAYADEENPR